MAAALRRAMVKLKLHYEVVGNLKAADHCPPGPVPGFRFLKRSHRHERQDCRGLCRRQAEQERRSPVRLVFPRHTAVDVESHIAMQLLEFPSVLDPLSEALAGELARQETAAQAAAKEKERLAAEQACLAEEQSMVVGERDWPR